MNYRSIITFLFAEDHGIPLIRNSLVRIKTGQFLIDARHANHYCRSLVGPVEDRIRDDIALYNEGLTLIYPILLGPLDLDEALSRRRTYR